MVRSLDQANQLSYSIILANILVEISFTNTPLTLKLFYSDAVIKHAYIRFSVAMLEFFPTFSFSMAFGEICMIASKRFDFNTINWVDVHYMTYEEYTSWRTLEIKTTNDVIHVRPIQHFVLMI